MPVPSMTYVNLLEDLRRYLERGAVDDITVFEQLPRLINLAERDIYVALKIQGFINVVTAAMVIGQSVYAKPDRWRKTISINFGTGSGDTMERNPMFPRSYEFCRVYSPAPADPAFYNTPKFYADYDYNNWLFAPTPLLAYPFEAVYYQALPYLEDANQTNWLTDYAPNMLLNGALLQATPFLKNDERIPVWKASYDRDINNWKIEDLEKIIDRQVVREEA